MSLSKIVEDYINACPAVRDSLLSGLINYSKLSRRIIDQA